MARPTPLTKRFAATLGFGERVRTRMVDRIAATATAPWADFDLPLQVTRIAPPPLLTVHDPADPEIPYPDSVALTTAWSGAEMVTTQGLGHWRVLRDKDVVARATDFTTAKESA